jgi:hypothetical protein
LIYTVGHCESYERYFADQGTPRKSGRNIRDSYPGGSVWRQRQVAQENCPEGYRVYGVMANWETDTIPSDRPEMHHLLVDAELVKLN